MIPTRRRARGFTLVELMICVAVLGILSSVAVPSYQRATLRSKAAERLPIMTAIARAVEETSLTQQRLPTFDPANPMAVVVWSGAPNPAIPSTSRMPFDWSMPGWTHLPMVVEGGTYYSYSFVAVDDPATLTTTLLVQSTGDLDADGTPSLRFSQYRGIGYSFEKTLDWPPPGVNEDIF